MQGMKRVTAGLLLALLSVLATGQDGPDVGSHSPSQAAADLLLAYARENGGEANGAFLAADLVKKDFSKDDLSSLIQYPTDEIVTVKLTGTDIRQALERSVSLYPLSNPSFLQLSGIEATFSKSAPPGQRITVVTVGGSKLDDKKTYIIVMPASLARGGLGYFKIWDSSKIQKRTFAKTVADVLKGKRLVDSSPRWSVSG